MATPNSPNLSELIAIQEKLDEWELEHLREHAAALFMQVQLLKEQVADLTRELEDSDDCAFMWQQTAEQLRERTGAQIAITRDGQVGVLQ